MLAHLLMMKHHHQQQLVTSCKSYIVFEASVNNYDIYPMIPIVTGAGGYISAPDGSFFTKGSVLATSNKILHDKALALLNVIDV